MTSEDLWLRILRNTFLKNVYFASWVRAGFATAIRADSLKHPVFPLNVKTWNEYSFMFVQLKSLNIILQGERILKFFPQKLV